MGQGKSTPKRGQHLMSMSREVRQLHNAVMINQWSLVQELADNGTDVDHVWFDESSPSVKNGTTPLCEAVSLNHVRVVEVLLRAGAQVNKPDQFGMTPLHKAAFHGRAALVNRLVKSGADINSFDPEMNTPLHICLQQCAVHNSSEAVLACINAGAAVNATNLYGLTPLHYAASWAAHDIVRILIKAQSEVDCIDRQRKTPLYYCIFAIMLRTRRLCGTESPTVRPLCSGNTKWKYSMLYKRLATIEILLMSGCDPLNFATWLRQNYSSSVISCYKDFYTWYVSTVPEQLKHLCRMAILKQLGCHPDYATLCDLPLSKSLINYLSRKLL